MHAIGLRVDGTVADLGNDAYGQRAVDTWTHITHVACGCYHSVGLRKDGTLVAVGDNDYGQCDVLV